MEAKGKRRCRNKGAGFNSVAAAQKACPGRQGTAELSGISSQPTRPLGSKEQLGAEETKPERIHHSFKNHHSEGQEGRGN